MKVSAIRLHQLKLPLTKPYRVSFRTYTEFEPILVQALGTAGETGWGEAYIPTGASAETSDTGWTYCKEQAEKIVGRTVAEAKTLIDRTVESAPFAATAMMTALDMLARHPALHTTKETRIPLLVPISGKAEGEIQDEVDRLVDTGYGTLKVKVGWKVDDDLARVGYVQKAMRDRARITMDANRGYSKAQGVEFAAALKPAGIDLFEQPCGAEDWDGNTAVAKAATVPLMLDESIRGLADIERASKIPGVRFVKLKLKRIGGIDRAVVAMQRANQVGLDICLGDGVATELMCWVEACTGRGYLKRAGDMNGYLKPKVRLLKEPLPFERGALVLRPGFWPEVDEKRLEEHTQRSERFGAATAAA